MGDEQTYSRINTFVVNFMHYITERLQGTPLLSSVDLPWQGIRVEQIHMDAGALPAQYRQHHLLIIYQVPLPYVVRHQNGGRVSEWIYQTGDLGLYPGGECDTNLSWTTPSNNHYLTVDDDFLQRLVGQEPTLSRFTLSERLKFHDPLLSQLGQQLVAATGNDHTLGRLYAESLTNALCCQLLEHHATYPQKRRYQPRLPASVLARIDAYLEAHPESPVTLAELADLANLSAFHFARLFIQSVGIPPYQYVLQRKIQRAKYLLRQDGAPISAISDALGFSSLSSFVTAFRRAVGCTPQQFQRR